MSSNRIGRVRAGYTAQYEDPISFQQGDAVEVTDKTTEWEGHPWVWCNNQTGKSGWVPQEYVETLGEQGVARMDYNAAELSVAEGEEVLVVDETHGWLLCRNAAGREGWVPAKHVEME